MEIHFCSLCNESVPQSDLDLGRAFLRRGRVICAVCERAMTHEAGAQSHKTTSTVVVESAQATAVAPAAVETTRTGTGRPDTVTSPGWTEPAVAPAALIPAATEAPAKSRGSSGLVLAMVALIFAAGGVAVLNEQI